MRTTLVLAPSDPPNWAYLAREPRFLYRRIADQQRAVLGVGAARTLDRPVFNTSGSVDDWVFGSLNYEWCNAVQLPAEDPSQCSWFIPRLVVEWAKDAVLLHVLRGEEADGLSWAQGFFGEASRAADQPPLKWSLRTGREEYLARVDHLLAHVHRGDIYEINYCIERTAHADRFDPYVAFERLLRRTQAPFAGFKRHHDAFALCVSPERFLRFDGRTIIGQPMKGTRPRSNDATEDERLRTELRNDAKERSENVMALDVMRHDLARVAASGSVSVPDLWAVVSFPNVHQMISTVQATLHQDRDPYDALVSCFPPASMTGAPKIRAIQLIAEAEVGPRGLFSGSLGFFAPDGTGDFNVVIRTAVFDAAKGSLSLRTGSAITARCEPGSEWDECTLKARSVIDTLGHA